MVSRLNDWRFSFVPFIIGCVYLWFYVFSIQLNFQAVILFLLSLLTTFGFAALGYFINEYFDMAEDAKAGKANKLALVSPGFRLVLLLIFLFATFFPWLWLPADNSTLLLVLAEVGLFILYSVPPIRLKRIPVVSGIADACYAYLVPTILAYHTYLLFSGKTLNNSWTISLLLFYVIVFFAGFRNIVVHQVNDVFNDTRSGLVTLPIWAGVKKTNALIALCVLIEVVGMITFSILTALQFPAFFIWLAIYLSVIIFKLYHWPAAQKNLRYLSIHETPRHFTDIFYQYLFPLFTLALLLYTDWHWILVAFLHFLLLVPALFYKKLEFPFWLAQKNVVAFAYFLNHHTIIPIRVAGNYVLFYTFLVVGVNLRKRKISAWQYIKLKWKGK